MQFVFWLKQSISFLLEQRRDGTEGRKNEETTKENLHKGGKN
jgi:hypothetical protein